MKPEKCYGGVRFGVEGPCLENVHRLDINFMPVVVAMQSVGILINKEHFGELSKYLQGEMDRLTDTVHSQTGFRINLGSPDQIEALLFRKIGLKPPPHFSMTKSGKRYIVDDEALSSIKHLHPCIPNVQQYTECHKLKTSYADVLPIIASRQDGRVRTNLRITRQVSGRVSSSEPNLMAQPTRSDLGKKIRSGFIAPPGWKLCTIDQSQIEMRFAAHRSQCINMMDTFLRNGDIHIETATRIFFSNLLVQLGRMPSKAETKAAGMDDMRHRYPAKRIGFGVLFGITPEGLQDQIFVADDPTWTDQDREQFRAEWPIERCGKTILEWFKAYPEVPGYMSGEVAKARRFGYTCDMVGRIRLTPQLKSVHKRIVEECIRQVGNFGIQASATASMKLFLTQCYWELCMGKYAGHVLPLLSIHDEGLFQAREEVVEDFLYDAGRIMESVVRLDVPIRFNTAFGSNWGDLDKA